MKKNILKLALPLMLFSAIALNQPPQKDKKNNPGKENRQPGKPAHAEQRGNADKGDKYNAGNNQGKNDNRDKNNNGKNITHDNNDKNKINENRNNDNGRNDNAHHPMKLNRDNFKDRKKIKNQQKVTVCHKVNKSGELPVSLTISENALQAHLRHGDVIGECPAVKDSRFSNIFLRNRTEYYNQLENSRNKAYYSRSILDYALERLTTSRSQLAAMRNNNLRGEDIQRKEERVLELEQNVSLLQTLLNAADGLLASRM